MIKDRIIIIYFGFMAFSLFTSCSSGPSEEPPEQPKNPPVKAVGVLPANGEPCSDFQSVPDEELKISILFKWDSAQNVNSYILVISEGANEVVRNTYTTIEANVILNRGKTYAWSVTSVNKDGETKSDTYSFTTPGVQLGNYAPYAANISVNFDANTSLMAASWTGADEDGDDLIYDARIFQGDTLVQESLDLTETSLDPIPFIPFTEYTIEVVSRDNFGNFSIARYITEYQ
jgi:hypothetical protein